MVVWLTLIYNLLLTGAVIGVLGWVYIRTQLAAVLTYLIYTVISQFVVPRAYAEAIASSDAIQWLGSSPVERVGNYYLFTNLAEHTVQAALLLWLILSLLSWSRTNKLPSWRNERQPFTPPPESQPDTV